MELFGGPDFLITLPDHNLPPLAAMFERYREREMVREELTENFCSTIGRVDVNLYAPISVGANFGMLYSAKKSNSPI